MDVLNKGENILPQVRFVCMPNAHTTRDLRIATRRKAAQSGHTSPLFDRLLKSSSTMTKSRKKRNRSSKFDFPDAFGPTRNTRMGNVAWALVKLRQFFSWK